MYCNTLVCIAEKRAEFVLQDCIVLGLRGCRVLEVYCNTLVRIAGWEAWLDGCIAIQQECIVARQGAVG